MSLERVHVVDDGPHSVPGGPRSDLLGEGVRGAAGAKPHSLHAIGATAVLRTHRESPVDRTHLLSVETHCAPNWSILFGTSGTQLNRGPVPAPARTKWYVLLDCYKVSFIPCGTQNEFCPLSI